MDYTFDNYLADGKVWKVNMTTQSLLSKPSEEITMIMVANSKREAYYNATTQYPDCSDITVRDTPMSKEEYYENLNNKYPDS